MPMFCGIDGAKHKISKLFTGIDGAKKSIKEMWAGNAGAKQKIFSLGPRIIYSFTPGDSTSFLFLTTDYPQINYGGSGSISVPSGYIVTNVWINWRPPNARYLDVTVNGIYAVQGMTYFYCSIYDFLFNANVDATSITGDVYITAHTTDNKDYGLDIII